MIVLGVAQPWADLILVRESVDMIPLPPPSRWDYDLAPGSELAIAAAGTLTGTARAEWGSDASLLTGFSASPPPPTGLLGTVEALDTIPVDYAGTLWGVPRLMSIPGELYLAVPGSEPHPLHHYRDFPPWLSAGRALRITRPRLRLTMPMPVEIRHGETTRLKGPPWDD